MEKNILILASAHSQIPSQIHFSSPRVRFNFSVCNNWRAKSLLIIFFSLIFFFFFFWNCIASVNFFNNNELCILKCCDSYREYMSSCHCLYTSVPVSTVPQQVLKVKACPHKNSIHDIIKTHFYIWNIFDVIIYNNKLLREVNIFD